MHIINQDRDKSLATDGRLANTFWLRLRGLLGKKSLSEGEGLVLVGEKSIHTLFMKFPIDILYIDKDYRVIRVDENMVPYRLGPFVTKSAYVLEVPVGTIAATNTKVGDQLKFEA
jgi:uncharacterized membrane protein (UPF0127 family)